VDAADDDPRRILAMGGGGFTMQERSPALDRLVLTLTGKPVPRICFLPTASGDPREQTTRFQERFGTWPCEPTILSLFHLARDRIDPYEHLLAQDAIYVGGGSMRNMLAIWREHGIDDLMRLAWQAGIVLAGLSAGAMCWFEGGISMSGGAPEAVEGIGLLPGSLSVHMTSEPERLPAYRRAVREDRLPSGYALDDGAALLFGGTAVREAVTSRPDARALRVESRQGEVGLAPIRLRQLPGADPSPDDLPGSPAPASTEQLAIAELRAVRAVRQRWG
jgi:peptidase E